MSAEAFEIQVNGGCMQQGTHREDCHHRASMGTPALSELGGHQGAQL